MRNPHRWLAAVLICAAGLGALLLLRDRDASAVPPESALMLDALRAPPLERVETRVLGRGQTLGTVLARAGIAGSEMATLMLALREHLNPRRLRPDVEVTIRRWADDNSTRSVELRLDADRTVRVERDPIGWDGRMILTPTVVDTVYASGVVAEGGSLWHAIMYDDEIPPSERHAVAYRLGDVYAFTLDFSWAMRPGDAYRMVYEREVRPDGTSRSQRILVAEIWNRGEVYPAVYFDPTGDDGDYYDRDGRSLRRAFLRSPLDYVRVTSSFSWRRYHPILGRYRAHLGTDFGADYGTPVKATGDGRVAFAGRNGGYGNFIEVRHPAGYTTRYAHLSRFAGGVRTGRHVEQGQIIGYVGATGLATAAHLHYEFRRYGRPLNSRTVDLPGGPPVPDAMRDDFERLADQRFALLAEITPPAGARLATGGEGEDAGPAPGAR